MQEAVTVRRVGVPYVWRRCSTRASALLIVCAPIRCLKQLRAGMKGKLMAGRKTLCVVCGEEVVYSEVAFEAECTLCGKKEMTNAACANGHYVCDICHRQEGADYCIEFCRNTDSTNPIEIITEAMGDKSIYQNGPEHHTLFGAALIAAYANAGGLDPEGKHLDKDAALDEIGRAHV